MNLKKIFSLAGLKKGLIVLLILLLIVFAAFTAFYFWAGSGTLPENKLSELMVYSHSKTLPDPPGNQEVFTVMTYNIGYLSGMTNNLPMKPGKTLFEKNMETFLTTLEEIQPDFIGFQEIDFHSHRSYFIDQLRTLAETCGFTFAARAVNWDKRYVPFPYWPPSVHFGKMLSGQAVLSRWPILSSERIVLQKPQNKPFYYNAFYLDRLVQVVKIKIGSKPLIILNVHLEAFEPETRENQAKKVLTLYRSFKDNYPVLLIGDFNCVPPSAVQKKNFSDEPEADYSKDKTIETLLKEKSLKRAFPGLNPIKSEASIFTFPADKPNRKLDYIFYNHNKIEFIRGFIPRIDSSDHLPLVMQFSLLKIDSNKQL